MGIKYIYINLADLLAVPCKINKFNYKSPYNKFKKNIKFPIIINN